MNSTKAEAFDRIVTARSESLADKPSIEYLLALRNGVQAWMDAIEAELEVAQREAADEETYNEQQERQVQGD